MKHGSVVIARFLGKAKDGKEDKRAPNDDPSIQFTQFTHRSCSPNDSGQVEDEGELVLCYGGEGYEFQDINIHIVQ